MRAIQAIVEIDDDEKYSEILSDFQDAEASFEDVDKYFMSHPVISKYPKSLREILWTCFTPMELTNNDLIGVKDIPSLHEWMMQRVLHEEYVYLEDFMSMPKYSEFPEMKRAEMIVKGTRDQSPDYTIPEMFPGGIKDKEVIQYLYENGDKYVVEYVKSNLM